MAVLAMFPLGSVLFPGAVLPLHVFEPRYRQLVQDCLAADEHEFGVVLIERGFEVGGGDVRAMAGTVARMVQVAEMADGRYAMVTVGTRRIRVVGWLPDDPYPLADVDDWPDEDAGEAGLADRAAAVHAHVRRITALAVEVGEINADTTAEISADPLLASYHLAAIAPLGQADRYKLLTAAGPAQRFDLLDSFLDEVEESLRFRLQHGGSGSGADFGAS